MELDTVTVSRRSIHGVIALISRTFFLNLISFGTSLIIFTVLKPSDVGIYTAVIAMQRVISFFTDFGFGAALVQKKEQLTQGDLATSFTIQSACTLLIFVGVLFLNPFIYNFFRLTEAADRLLLILVFCIFLSSFKTIPSILLERNIRFQELIIPQIVEALLFNLVLIILVLKGFGLNAFSYAFLSSSLISIPFYYYVSPWKIRLGINKDSLQHLKFGLQFQAKNVLATIKDDFLTVFLTRFISYTQLGYIGFGQKFAFFPFRYIVDSVTKVTFSTYARIQHDKGLLRKAIEKSLFFVSITMFPILSGTVIIMPYLIRYMPQWHNKWEPALISLLFFSLNAGVSALSNILVNVLDATGRVKTTLRLMVLWTILTWILTPLFILMYGYNGVAIASFLITITIGITIYLVKKIVDFSFFSTIYKPFFATVVMSILIYYSAQFLVKDLVTLICIVLFGAGIYLGSMYTLAKEELKENIKIFFKKQL